MTRNGVLNLKEPASKCEISGKVAKPFDCFNSYIGGMGNKDSYFIRVERITVSKVRCPNEAYRMIIKCLCINVTLVVSEENFSLEGSGCIWPLFVYYLIPSHKDAIYIVQTLSYMTYL